MAGSFSFRAPSVCPLLERDPFKYRMFLSSFDLCTVFFRAFIAVVATLVCSFLACLPPRTLRPSRGWDHVCRGWEELWAYEEGQCSGTHLRRQTPCRNPIPVAPGLDPLPECAAHIPCNAKYSAEQFSSLADPQAPVEKHQIWVEILAQSPNSCEILGGFLYPSDP